MSQFALDNLWILMASAMVFIMHLGFATLEAGVVRAKNSVNILFKNTAIISLGLLSYAGIGFALMYPGAGYEGGVLGFAGFGLLPPSGAMTVSYSGSYTYWTDFIFQAMFAATAATIVSGAVAERIKLGPFLVFSLLFLAFCYPVVGMWKWGGGFLDTMSTPFYDFAGSTLVHAVGGWAALMGAVILGPRIGRFSKTRKRSHVDGGSDQSRPGSEFGPSNSSLATIGVFLLWFGWYGFNGGSVLSTNPEILSLVFVTTSLAAAAGICGSLFAGMVFLGKRDLMLSLNGALAGLVSITAGADVMGPGAAVLVGFLGGLLLVGATVAIEKLRIDDPVGAVPVHLICGIWGTLAVGIFGAKASVPQFASQCIGVAVVGLFTVIFSYAVFELLDFWVGLRVTKEEEHLGLDVAEHTSRSYAFGSTGGEDLAPNQHPAHQSSMH